VHESTRPSAAVIAVVACLALVVAPAAFLGGCGSSQATPATAEQRVEPTAASGGESRPEPQPAAPCIADSLARYEREAAFACLLELDHPHEDLRDMGLGEATRAKASERFGQLGDEAVAPLLATIDQAMGIETLSAKLVAELSANVTDAQIRAMLEHSATPLGRRERMLMEVEPDPEAFAAWSEQTELGEVRSKLVAEYCQASGVSSLGEVIVATPAVRMTTAMTVALQPEMAAQRQQVAAQIRQQLAPGIEAFQQGICGLLAYSTRTLSDAELRQATAFYRTPEAAGYNGAQIGAFTKVLGDAYEQVGTAMAPLAKQVAEAEAASAGEGEAD
jgi:hypothetical protein